MQKLINLTEGYVAKDLKIIINRAISNCVSKITPLTKFELTNKHFEDSINNYKSISLTGNCFNRRD